MPKVALDSVVTQYSTIFQKVESLQARAGKLILQIQEIYRQIGAVASDAGKGRGKVRAAGVSGRNGAKRAPRGALKAAIYKILAGGKPVRPADIVRQLPKVGFQSASTPRVLYTNVYLTMKRDKTIQKTAEGFKLKAGGKK